MRWHFFVFFISVLLGSMCDAASNGGGGDDADQQQDHQLVERIQNEIRNNVTASKILKCQSCKIISLHFHHVLNAEQSKLSKKLSLARAVELMEDVCDSKMQEIGLVIDEDNNPTLTLTSQTDIKKAHGGWMKLYLENVCGELFSDHDAVILKTFENNCKIDAEKRVKTCTVAPFLKKLCHDSFPVCPAREFEEPEGKKEL